MTKENGKPQIRFAGFDEAWEQRKLSEVVKEIKRTNETSNAPVMMITAENGLFLNCECADFVFAVLRT